MTKDNKVNIKIEVCRDKNSGKLSLLAHFNANASNIKIEKNEYFWWPTPEEKDLLNEAFELMPLTQTMASPKPVQTTPEPAIIEEPTTPNIDTEIKKPTELLPLEKEEKPAEFEITTEEPKKDDIIEEINKNDLDTKVDIKTPEPTKDEITENNKKEEDEGIIVEADAEAIDAALKKHVDKDKDESIVEADEQTIIDKVLSQKKKGKWNKLK